MSSLEPYPESPVLVLKQNVGPGAGGGMWLPVPVTGKFEMVPVPVTSTPTFKNYSPVPVTDTLKSSGTGVCYRYLQESVAGADLWQPFKGAGAGYEHLQNLSPVLIAGTFSKVSVPAGYRHLPKSAGADAGVGQSQLAHKVPVPANRHLHRFRIFPPKYPLFVY